MFPQSFAENTRPRYQQLFMDEERLSAFFLFDDDLDDGAFKVAGMA
jgi:hypothetical protein